MVAGATQQSEIAEHIRDVFDKDEAKHEVFVLGSIHVGTQLVRSGPESFLNIVEHLSS